jgi:mono/diheme cytochrome c family protein
MKTARACLSLAALASFQSAAHDVITTQITFSREISRLVYSRCASCHRPGGSAFSLLTYAEARPWAKAIKEEALERRMPPWGAVKGFAEFRDDQGLTEEQLELISDWVEGGAPEGDPKHLPKLPDFAAAGAMPSPAGLAVRDGFSLKSPLRAAGVRADGVPQGGSFMAMAQLPDGAIEPLLWIYNYAPAFARAYWYAAPLQLPPGSRIVIAPPNAGGIVLLTKTPSGRR